MSEWQTFTGSPEQFLALAEVRHGVIVKGMSEPVPITDLQELTAYFRKHGTLEFLICNPHPLEDMICQQARTGQEVWVLEPFVFADDISVRVIVELMHRENVGTAILENGIFCQYSTRTPYWHIPDAQYSFTRFGGYRANK